MMATKDLLRESFTASAQRVYRESAAKRAPYAETIKVFERLRRAAEKAGEILRGYHNPRNGGEWDNDGERIPKAIGQVGHADKKQAHRAAAASGYGL